MSERYEGQTYYELLEIQPAAGPTEIYEAYQRARSTYSPTSPALYSMFTPQEAQELLVLIDEAYRTLSHQARRQEYDEKLGIAAPKRPVATAVEAKASRSTDNWVGPVKFIPRSKEELPKGFARTKFSVYEINQELETEIKSISECDGAWLQRVRLYKGVTLDQMSEEIRVIKSTIVALEANDLDVLPVPVFTRGFVVQIARVLGLNEKQIADAYMKFFRAKKVGG